jgi:hypothetical protein
LIPLCYQPFTTPQSVFDTTSASAVDAAEGDGGARRYDHSIHDRAGHGDGPTARCHPVYLKTLAAERHNLIYLIAYGSYGILEQRRVSSNPSA